MTTLVPDIYNAVADESQWPEILSRIAEELDVFGCIIFDLKSENGERRIRAPYASANYNPAMIDIYLDMFHSQELGIQDLFETQLAKADDIEIFSDTFLDGSPVMAAAGPSIEWLKQIGIGRRAAGFLDKDNHKRGRFSLQICDGDPPLQGEQHAKTMALLPHIAKALELGRPARQLATIHSGLIAAMDRLRVGVCILDSLGRIAASNLEFQRQREETGIYVVTDKDRLELRDPENQRQLSNLLGDLRHHGRFGARPRKEAIIATRDPSDRNRTLCIEVAPLDYVDEMGSGKLGGAILYSLDPKARMNLNIAAIQAAFDLTGAELSLLELIAEGHTNRQIADLRDRSVMTVNAQVKSILSKTYCGNRTQLARLLSGFSNGFLRPD
ncbi:MAG: LuxR C-terminal-related transcriptional regulator [Pseudomonadota bacterium]